MIARSNATMDSATNQNAKYWNTSAVHEHIDGAVYFVYRNGLKLI